MQKRQRGGLLELLEEQQKQTGGQKRQNGGQKKQHGGFFEFLEAAQDGGAKKQMGGKRRRSSSRGRKVGKAAKEASGFLSGLFGDDQEDEVEQQEGGFLDTQDLQLGGAKKQMGGKRRRRSSRGRKARKAGKEASGFLSGLFGDDQEDEDEVEQQEGGFLDTQDLQLGGAKKKYPDRGNRVFTLDNGARARYVTRRTKDGRRYRKFEIVSGAPKRYLNKIRPN